MCAFISSSPFHIHMRARKPTDKIWHPAWHSVFVISIAATLFGFHPKWDNYPAFEREICNKRHRQKRKDPVQKKEKKEKGFIKQEKIKSLLLRQTNEVWVQSYCAKATVASRKCQIFQRIFLVYGQVLCLDYHNYLKWDITFK